jgi:predicted metalloprotease
MALRERGRRLAWLLTALVALIMLTAACSSGGDEAGRAQPSTSGTAGSGSASARPETFADDARAAIEVSEPYWKSRLGGDFRPITQVIPYRSAGQVSCGGEAIGSNNAAYCTQGDFIAYDQRWAQQAYDKIGDAFIYYLLAHEYAHAIQVRLGEQYRFTIEQELQADCMAGAVIGDAIKAGRLQLESGDLEELRTGLVAVGDQPGQPWFAEGSHGTAEQRVQAFFAGYDRSLDACNL